MKNVFLSLVVFCSLGACTESALEPEIIIDPSESFLEGEWKLVKSRGSMVDVTLGGDALERSEIYSFSGDGDFEKSIEEDDFNGMATGTYSIEEVSEELADEYVGVVVLTFTEGDDIAGNCTSGDEETEDLYISKKGQLENIDWAPCDGPYLYYEKQ
ncbi:hypothetical protein GCM10028791_22210 [Echinicola sediminis]